MRFRVSALLLATMAASPAFAQSPNRLNLAQLFKESVRSEVDGSDAEKRRIARFGLNQSYMGMESDAAPDDLRIRWKLNRVKMRMPFDTSSFQ
jgi:hypothetical protein